MEKNYKYDAFISYRHISPDREIADRLQKKLENYKPPKALYDGKAFEHWRVFRDETELPTSSDLSNDIKAALEESKFLVVVCSKATMESRWCMEEIEYFKQLHNGNNANIITLVADGNPQEVFPPSLCNELIPVTDAHGNTSYQNHVIEPLAANVAGKSVKESLKKLNTEFLRIVAPILGCGYDDLYNREQKKRVRRMLAIAGTILALLLLFGVYNSAMLWEINNQKTALAAANVDLQKKTDELNLSNENLKKSNQELEKKTKEAEKNLAEAKKQKKLAEDNLKEADAQKKKAEANLKEANKQKKFAEENLKEAEKQEAQAKENLHEAEKQKKLAEENAAEAEKQKNVAQENEQEAKHQKELAEANAKEAEAQKSIAEANMIIAQENEAKANEQTRLAQIENSENLNILSKKLWDSGDGIAAIRTVLSALPDENRPRPIVSSAMRTLANEIGAFESESFTTVSELICEDHVQKIGYAGNGATLISQDSTGIYFWESKTGELKKKYLNSDFNNSDSSVAVYFDNTGNYESLGAYNEAVGYYMRNENNYLMEWKKQDIDEKTLSNTDVLVRAGGNVYKLDGVTGEILWEIQGSDSYGYYVDVTDTMIIFYWTDYTANDNARTVKLSVYDRVSGEFIAAFNIENSNLLSLFGNWIAVTNDKAYYLSDNASECTVTEFDIMNESLINRKVVYDSSKDLMCEKYDTTNYDKVQVIDGNLYITKTHWNTMEYTFMTDIMVIDNTGQKKWNYSYQNDFLHNNHVRLELFDAAMCKSFCDVLAVVKGNRVVLLNHDTGEHIFTYELDSIIEESYCSVDGFLVAITANGYEVGMAPRKIKQGVTSDVNFPMVQLHKFMSAHALYAYSNRQYAVSNGNSNEIYLYSDVKNDNYKKLLTEEGGIDNVLINNSQTYIAINSFKEVYIYDVGAHKTYELIKSEEYLRDALFMSDYLYVVIDNENNISIFDLRTKELVYKKNCENISLLSNGGTYSYACSVGGYLIFRENYNDFAILNDRYEMTYWKPQKPIVSDYREWDEGRISNVYCFAEKGKILAEVRYLYGSGVSFEIYDVHTGEAITLDTKLADSNENKVTVKSVAWTEDEVIIAFSDNIVRWFDINTGTCKSEIKYNVPSIVSIVWLDDSASIALLCNDSTLYRVSAKSDAVIDSVSLGNDNIKTATYDNAITEIIREHNILILSGWQEKFAMNHAYIINLDTFDVIYDIDGYAGYLSSQNKFLTEVYNSVGLYPFYTAEALVAKAKAYITE